MQPSNRKRERLNGRSPVVQCLESRLLMHGAGQPEALHALPSGVAVNAAVTNAAPTTFPLSSLPQLSSKADAPAKIYLDFNSVSAMQWGSYSATRTPAYDLDGDETTYSQTELTAMQQIWSRVAEKYSPFNVNVTTVDPGTYNYNQVVRVAIGGNGQWAWANPNDPNTKVGGFTYPNGFSGNTSNTSFVFPQNLGSGFPKYVAEAIAHEVGHAFGLDHQAAYNAMGVQTSPYRGGRDGASPNAYDPIMGFSYYATRGLWSNGQSTSSSIYQDDMGIIAGNVFHARDDDYGNAMLAAAALAIANGTDASGAGIIENAGDVDYFKFHSDGGLMRLAADVAPLGPMLDLKLSLMNSLGGVLASADTATLGEFVSAIVPAGDYYLAVASHGNYGDVGQYTITGTVVPEPLSAPAVILMGVAWLCQRGEKKQVGRGKFGQVEIRHEPV